MYSFPFEPLNGPSSFIYIFSYSMWHLLSYRLSRVADTLYSSFMDKCPGLQRWFAIFSQGTWLYTSHIPFVRTFFRSFVCSYVIFWYYISNDDYIEADDDYLMWIIKWDYLLNFKHKNNVSSYRDYLLRFKPRNSIFSYWDTILCLAKTIWIGLNFK